MDARVAETDGRRMRHIAAIKSLAAEVERPLDEVAAVYQCELVRLGAHAVVLDYLPVLVMKRVRTMYRHRLDALHQDDLCSRPVTQPDTALLASQALPQQQGRQSGPALA